jgi:hypothetical protein
MAPARSVPASDLLLATGSVPGVTGLARRFQLSQAWLFEDYDKEDLLHIMKEAARKRSVSKPQGQQQF